MPRLLAMQGGGVEISDRSVKYMQFSGRSARAVRVASFGEIPLPEGTVVDGEIKDIGTLIRVLIKVRSECGFSLCYASLPESKGYLFSDQLPHSAAADVQGALALALSSHVPISPAEAVYDCEVMDAENSGDGISVVAAAISEDLTLSYNQALSDAGFLPVSFELEPQAAARAVAPLSMQQPDRATIVADLGETKTMLCIVEGSVARFTTSGEGSAALDALVAKESGADSREIIRRKIDIGITRGSNEEIGAFLTLADRYAVEISRLAIYWNAHGAQEGSRRSVGTVILYGGNANMKGLAEYLSPKVGLPVSVAHIWEAVGNTKRVHPISADQSMRFATVAGLALRALFHGPIE